MLLSLLLFAANVLLLRGLSLRVPAADGWAGILFRGVIGLGLGMSIVKQSIEAHGGKIHVTSDVNKGTVVTFFLPYRTA